MSQDRQPYEKPLVRRLPYMVDQHVSLGASCKTTGSAGGPTVGACKSVAGNVPCVALGS